MHKSKDEAKRSRSPEMRADSSNEVRARTPLGRSETSSSEEFEPPTSSIKAQDITSSPSSEALEPSMPYFLQLSDMEIARKFNELNIREKQRLEEACHNPNSKWAICDSPECITLDRYLNIQPWASNRVRLRVTEGKNDYINASPVTIHHPENKSTNSHKYIVMQGPKENTVSHTWRLIWDEMESPAVVVMLTDLEEAGKEKCYQYFPKDADSPPLIINDHDEFGDGFKATVSFAEKEETEQGDAIEVRKLVMRVEIPVKDDAENPGDSDKATDVEQAEDAEEGGAAEGEEQAPEEKKRAVEVKEKVIWHLLYTRWPDFGVPAVEEVDSFYALMELSRAKNTVPGNPRIVHCSAGVGRSGTFIALEHLLAELEAGGMVYYGNREPPKPKGTGRKENLLTPARKAAEAVNEKDLVFDTVDRLRQQRKMMVQADSQYQFIYRVLKRCWEVKYRGWVSETAKPKDEICQTV